MISANFNPTPIQAAIRGYHARKEREEYLIDKVTKVELSMSAKKQIKELFKEHPKVYAQFAALDKDIEKQGPYRKNWPHFSVLGKRKGIPRDSYHCHIKGGKPTYVACCYIEDEKVKIVENYVGTHEKAPY